MTQIREPNFSIDLPGEWEEVESDEPGATVYQMVEGDASVKVMLLAVRPMFAIADQRRLVEDYMSHRSKFEAGQIPGLEAGQPVSHETEGAIEGVWSAADDETGVRRLHRVILAGGLLADFMYEVWGAEPSGFLARAGTALATASANPEAEAE